MSVRTPRWVERRWKLRLSLHFFRNHPHRDQARRAFGIHVKIRRGDVFRHAVVKVTRGAAYGRPDGRRLVYIGWWQSRKGVRQQLNGWRLFFGKDRLPKWPAESQDVPFFPVRARDRDEEFEVL